MKTLLVTIILLTSNSNIWACTCIGESTVKKDFKRSDLVVVGKVIDSQLVKIWSDTSWTKTYFDDLVEKGEIDPKANYNDWKNNKSGFFIELVDYTIIVEERYKGAKGSDTIKVRTGFGNGDCGFKFLLGQKYLIYAQKEHEIKYKKKIGRSRKQLKGIYRTNICWKTKSISLATEELKKIKN